MKLPDARRTLAPFIDDLSPAEMDLAAIAADIHRARREFTDDELTPAEHAARLDALETLRTHARP